MKPQTQIAFDFGDLPQKPLPENILSTDKETVVKNEAIAFEPAATIAVKEKSTRGRKSLKDMCAGADLIEVPDDAVLYQKMYYSIGKVAEMFKVNQSLIRMWENEFDVLKPKKNGKGDRLFRPEDIKNIQLIYHLMREKKYTMEGAKDFIKNNKRATEKFQIIEALKRIKGFLNELKANL
ncbi:MAG: MerR family transcriptional regulator [Aquabacterium sp.]|nr:MerR family transcriptional regulator [Ferruginibacter sp.]